MSQPFAIICHTVKFPISYSPDISRPPNEASIPCANITTVCARPSADISLHKELMNPAQLHNIGSVDRLMFGLLYQPAQRRDVFISRELTNRLFQTNRKWRG